MTTTALPTAADGARIGIVTSHQKLERVFYWAKDKALSYVQTGKSGVRDRHERNLAGEETVRYIPCYWAGYTTRTAFYSRDYCHQAFGAHLLGLKDENWTMLRAFAASANESRKWFPLWALNFDGSPFKLDWRGDSDFVREVPAVFELVEQTYRQYLWTGNRDYLEDATLRKYCERALTDFIALHDSRRPNGVAEGDGSGDIFRGSATYNEVESRAPLVESGDGIACQYQALLSYAHLLRLGGEKRRAEQFALRAQKLRQYFQTTWGVLQGRTEYVRGYDRFGKAHTDFGLENSWFLPMKLLPEPGEKTDAYLDFIAHAVESKEGRPSNLEAISYLPGVFFPYHRVEEAWKWLEYILDQPDKEYPEISFTILGHIVEGLMGVELSAPTNAFATLSRLPKAIETLGVTAIPLGNHKIDVTHEGALRSLATHRSGEKTLTWEARFHGEHKKARLNGREAAMQTKKINGVSVSFVKVRLAVGKKATVEVLPSAP